MKICISVYLKYHNLLSSEFGPIWTKCCFTKCYWWSPSAFKILPQLFLFIRGMMTPICVSNLYLNPCCSEHNFLFASYFIISIIIKPTYNESFISKHELPRYIQHTVFFIYIFLYLFNFKWCSQSCCRVLTRADYGSILCY